MFPHRTGWERRASLHVCIYLGLPPYKPQLVFITKHLPADWPGPGPLFQAGSVRVSLVEPAVRSRSQGASEHTFWVQVSFLRAANNPLIPEGFPAAPMSSLWAFTHWSPLWPWRFRWLVSCLSPQSLRVRLDLLLRRGVEHGSEDILYWET